MVAKMVDVMLDGELIHSYPIHLGNLSGAAPGDAEFIAQARDHAELDELLSPAGLAEAEFIVRNPRPGDPI